jgi:hypothetical protein
LNGPGDNGQLSFTPSFIGFSSVLLLFTLILSCYFCKSPNYFSISGSYTFHLKSFKFVANFLLICKCTVCFDIEVSSFPMKSFIQKIGSV